MYGAAYIMLMNTDAKYNGADRCMRSCNMDIKPILTENDYQEALKIVSGFFDNEPEPDTPEGNTFDILLTLIESYEAKNFHF